MFSTVFPVSLKREITESSRTTELTSFSIQTVSDSVTGRPEYSRLIRRISSDRTATISADIGSLVDIDDYATFCV